MSKTSTVILFLVVIALTVGAGAAVYSYVFRDKGEANTKQEDAQPTQEDAQPTKVVKSEFVPGTREMLKGTFVSAEDRRISFKEGDVSTEFPLNDEVMIICTEQDLNELTEIDYQSEMGEVYNPDTLGSLISPDEPIVVVSQELRGAQTVHTVVVSSDSCPE